MASPEIRVEHSDDVCRLSGTINFDTAPACLTAVSALVTEQRSLTIDLSGIDKSNSAGLALMIEWLAVARRSGHTVSFTAVPDGLNQLAKVSQVDSLLE